MHAFFLLSALVLAALLSLLGAGMLRLLPIGTRRPAALVVLALPPVVLVLAATHLIPFFWAECAPLVGWDQIASFGLLGGWASLGLGALALGIGRLLLVNRLLPLCAPPDGAVLANFRLLADRLGVPLPKLRVLPSESPIAVAGGLREPCVVLSTWLLEHLDRSELDSVVTHELAHLARRDYLSRWLGRVLRDASVFLPGAWYAFRALEADEELSADAVAVTATGQPLAMASALGKVWRALSSADTAVLASAPAYGGSAELIEQRLLRLLNGHVRPGSTVLGRVVAGISLVGTIELTAQLLMLSATTIPFVCGMRA